MVERRVRRVLIVDDDLAYLEAARAWMPGREVLVETSSVNVLSRVRSEHPDLAVVDVVLGDENGVELVKRLKAEVPALPVALVSAAFDARSAAIGARTSGADIVLPKQGARTFDEIIAFVEHGVEPDLWATGNKRESPRAYATRLLVLSGGNKSEAARRAQVSWATMNRWLSETD